MATIDTGNPFDDFPKNIKEVLDTTAAKTAIGHKLTFDTIEPFPSSLPAICIEFDSSEYNYDNPVMDTEVVCNVYYLNSKPGQSKREADIRKALWTIFETLHTDGNCNGYSEFRLMEATTEIATIAFGPTGFENLPEFNGGRLQVRYGKKQVH